MKLTISGSKNSESLYIQKSYKNNQGKSSTTTVRKLGKLTELCETLGTDRDGVIAWAKEQVRIETEKYKAEKETNNVVMLESNTATNALEKPTLIALTTLFPLSISSRIRS